MYDIWVEGYATTGERGSAQRICRAPGNSFAEACRNAFFAGNFAGYGNFDPDRLSLWGCRLYDNENDARRSFG